ncbi:myeloid cell surface antigen CD33-like [Mugil cephalus]|uniref:myeloid cell surface antigen CD33-like n=1 Tax=Mugil cephalus TaxID=48193 RepID=UPI001FB758FB|nr:myeloid cell surface antigen CD33-like [Mugil cephalus]XP_047455639.1 myeloid cell surface antigen CD33-like [Mugil cephalus]
MDTERKMLIFTLLLTAVCSPVFSGEWKATVAENLDALVTSCVVVPCSFTHGGGLLPNSRLRGLWHRQDKFDQFIYHEDQTRVLDNFKGRTQLLGHLGENNCTLEITEMKDHDNGPFCFRVEVVLKETNEPTKDMFSFVKNCVQFKMLHGAPKPVLTPPKTAIEGKPYTIICSVTHTCPSHVPKLTWNRGTEEDITEIHKHHGGNWEATSTLTFVAQAKDDYTDLTCTAEFYGGKTSSSAVTLSIKRSENYNHIIIPVAVGIGTAVIFGLFCVFMVKKYKKRIAELQNQEGTMLNRLHRLSQRARF